MTKKQSLAFAAAIKKQFGLDRPWEEVSPETRYSALCAVDIVIRVAVYEDLQFNVAAFRKACGTPA